MGLCVCIHAKLWPRNSENKWESKREGGTRKQIGRERENRGRVGATAAAVCCARLQQTGDKTSVCRQGRERCQVAQRQSEEAGSTLLLEPLAFSSSQAFLDHQWDTFLGSQDYLTQQAHTASLTLAETYVIWFSRRTRSIRSIVYCLSDGALTAFSLTGTSAVVYGHHTHPRTG